MKTTVVELHMLIPETDVQFTVQFPARRPIEDCMESIMPMIKKNALISDIDIIEKEV